MHLNLRPVLAILLLAGGPVAAAAAVQDPPVQDPPPQNPPPQNPPQDPLEDVTVPEGVLQDEGEYLLLDLAELDDQGLNLRQFIKVCQLNTGLNFTLDETTGSMRQKLDSKRLLLYGPKRIRKSDFYSFFQIMMKIHGYVCVQQGAGDLAVVVITEQLASNSALIKANAQFVDHQEVENFADKPGTYLYTVIPLKYADAQDLGTNLRTALASQSGDNSAFMPLAQERALLVQGYGPFVAASVRMIQVLDKKPPSVQVVFKKIPLREQDAEEMAEVLTELVKNLSEQVQAGNRTRGTQPGELEPETVVIAFRPDNSLIVTGTDENIEKLMDLVAQLDARVDDPESSYHVYVLQYLSAKELDEALTEFVTDSESEAERANRESAAGGGASRSGLFSEQKIIVEVHEETNAILVSATRNKWAELKTLLDRLDKRQPQVLIETALIEISNDFEQDIGIEYASVEEPEGDSQRGFGFTSVGITTAENFGDARLPSPTAAGLTFGILDGEDLGIPVIVKAAQTRDDANILSVPSILVSNNKGAAVRSTDKVPYQTSNSTQGTVAANFEFTEAGITLEITPSISAQKYLRLHIKLEVSSFRGDGANGGPPPVTTRSIETFVSLPDGATMWLGGIIRDDVLENESGIPYLSDIPIIGFLFGRNIDRNIKTTLFFFCTPRIIEEFDELADVSEAGKARAADTIGLDRVRMVDPAFQLENPVDVILEGDGESAGGNGTLNFSGFAAPIYERTGGEMPAAGGAPPPENP